MLQAVFDTLGDFNFAFAGQQFYRAHFAHVHTHWISRATKVGIHGGQSCFGFVLDVVVAGCHGRVIAHEQGISVGSLVVNRNPHVTEGADNAINGFDIDQIVRQMVIDFAVGQVTPILTQLNQCLQAIAARFLFFRAQLTTYTEDIFFGFGTLGTTLGHWLEIRNDLFFAHFVVIDKVNTVVIGIFCRTSTATTGSHFNGRLLGSRFFGYRFFRSSLLSGFLGRRCAWLSTLVKLIELYRA